MRRLITLVTLFTVACASPEATALAPRPGGTGALVKFDVFHRPLPEIPLPNDFATRFDASSPTKRRINASMVAPTEWERKTRASLDEVDGWGTLAPITVGFDQPLDVENIIKRHHGDRYDTKDDVMLLVDVTPGSPEFCKAAPLDLGEGLYPARLDRPEYYADDPRGSLSSLVLEEVEEDVNGNGALDPGEDTDMDGVLDHPNTRTGQAGSPLITFYERETRTLIARPVYPLREATTYAVVLTRELLDTTGQPVRSPFMGINHASQTKALQPLADECLKGLGRTLDDVAFTWSFTTQHWTKPLVAVRDGLYGLGPLARLATEFPAEMTLRDARARGSAPYTRIVPNSIFIDMAKSLYSDFGSGNSQAQEDLFFDNFGFIDFHAVGTIDSPQFFPRWADEEKKVQLPLTEQVWKLNSETGEAFTRHEGVNYWLMVPKHRTGPAPVAIFVHGHGSTKFDAMNVAGFLARMGIATMGIDAVSHGVDVDPVLLEVVKGQFKQRGIEGMGLGIVEGRALDQNADGKLDSGVDYWTAYIAHTRDVVRQTAVDLFQVVRTLKSFDGQRTWKYDANLDGQPDLAGDLDGDGKVDIGGSAAIHLVGGSLGGIISSYVGGLEPQIETAIPIIGGGGLGDIGTRSSLSGVRDAMVLRMMAPLFLVADGKVTQYVPDLVEGKALPVATLTTTPKPGSIAVLTNLTTGEWRCARVQRNGHLRVAVPSDKGDRLALRFYGEELPSREREGCEPRGQPTEQVTAFEGEVKFQGTTYAAGAELVAVTDGFGLRRGNPELRRMMGLAQVALEGADPANTAPFLHGDRTLTYGTGETVQTRVFYINTMGDSGVPTASGVTMSRAAGLVDFRAIDPRYGKTVQQVLLDSGTVESVEASGRWQDSTGRNVLMDIDDLANVSTVGDGFDVPRLNPPLRILRHNTAAQGGGISAQLFPMMDPTGTHGFPQPKPEKPFDLGSLLIGQMIRYLATNGQELSFDACQLDWSCSWLPPIP